jgi:hypothetical protein
VTNETLPSLNNTTWYLGVPNNRGAVAYFTISAITLASSSNVFDSPAFVISKAAVAARAGGFTFEWSSVGGGHYQVLMTTNLVNSTSGSNWTTVTNIITSGATGAYTDPAPIASQPARFYRVIRTE